MKKVIIALVLLLVVGVALLAGLSPWGFGGMLVWNEQTRELHGLAKEFLQDIKFKDFTSAGAYHTWGDSQKENIPQLIERLFAIKPELLDLHDYEVTKVELDETGLRARTLFKAHYRVLNSARNKDEKDEDKVLEGILYWHKRPEPEARPAAEAAKPDQPPAPPPVAAAPAPSQPRGPGVPPPFLVDKDGKRWFMMLESSLR